MPETPKSRAPKLPPDPPNIELDVDSPETSSPNVGSPNVNSHFEAAAQQRAPNVIVEFTDFLLHNKKWWLTPIILVLLVFSLFIALTSSAVAPFIYVLF